MHNQEAVRMLGKEINRDEHVEHQNIPSKVPSNSRESLTRLAGAKCNRNKCRERTEG